MAMFKILSVLLDYPTERTVAALPEIRELLAGAATGLAGFVDALAAGDLLDWQSAWVEQFDRTRSLSLNLFEHVHGESRDRGQAMVDLQDTYRRKGLELAATELPDYLPLFLEFLSTEPEAEARELLGEAAHVVTALAERLAARNSAYAPVMAAVAGLAGDLLSSPRPPISTPDTDEDPDAAWAEEPVEFGGGAAPQACGGLSAATIAALQPREGA